jgi:rod shape-determining protein MreC
LIFNIKDSTKIENLDSIKGVKKIDIIIAKVIKNSYSSQVNFLTLDSGSNQGVQPEMGVINSLGIVGVIENVSPKYSTVLSILNTESPINAKVKKSNHIGSLTWNGKNTGYVQLVDVPRLATVKKGDTIVTGAQSTIFPENINIGTVDKYYTDNQTNFYTIDVKLFNDMTSLGHVYIIKNKDRNEIKTLEKKTQKNE